MPQPRAGTPGPDRWIRHESIKTASKGIENISALFAGATAVNGVPMSALVVCAGASRGRVRFLASCAGSLKLEFCRPTDKNTVATYANGNPAAVAIVANTENLLSTPDISGEANALITFTPSAGGTITFVDWMAL